MVCVRCIGWVVGSSPNTDCSSLRYKLLIPFLTLIPLTGASVKDNGFEDVNIRTNPPCIPGKPGFDARLFEKGPL